jgi:hypothetical protein
MKRALQEDVVGLMRDRTQLHGMKYIANGRGGEEGDICPYIEGTVALAYACEVVWSEREPKRRWMNELIA